VVFIASEESLSHVTEESSETQTEAPEKATPNLLQVLLRIISENDSKMPDEVRCNACVLLEKALFASKRSKDIYHCCQVRHPLNPNFCVCVE